MRHSLAVAVVVVGLGVLTTGSVSAQSLGPFMPARNRR